VETPQSSQVLEKQVRQQANQGERGHLVFIERRASPRFPAVEDHVWTGWWTNLEEFVTTACEIDNISQGGARIMTAIPPNENERLWIRLAKPGSAACLQATVLEIQPIAEDSYWVRLEFAVPCPKAFFDAAVGGMKHPSVGPVDASV
jgi:hypothetical protein